MIECIMFLLYCMSIKFKSKSIIFLALSIERIKSANNNRVGEFYVEFNKKQGPQNHKCSAL